MLLKLGFFDYEKNQVLLNNCKDKMDIVIDLLLKEQKKTKII